MADDFDDQLDKRLKAIIDDPTRESRLGDHNLKDPPFVLLGYRTATSSPQSALLKLEVLIQSRPVATTILPIILSRSACTDLGNALLRLATLPHRPHELAS